MLRVKNNIWELLCLRTLLVRWLTFPKFWGKLADNRPMDFSYPLSYSLTIIILYNAEVIGNRSTGNTLVRILLKQLDYLFLFSMS